MKTKEFLNNLKIEKSADQKWRAFQKIGVNGWIEVKKEKSYTDLKKWILDSSNKNSQKRLGL